MKRTLSVAALALAAAAIPGYAADAPQIAKPQCEPVPRAPGPAMRNDEFAMKRFKRETTRYGDCMKAYVDQHQALAKANQEAANAAADEYNNNIKAINEELKQD